MRTAPEAMKVANSQTRNDVGMCQKWTRDLYLAPSAGDRDSDGDADAVDGWKSEPASARFTDRKPDIGAPGAWGGGSSGHGHRAICIGYLDNGEALFRSTDGNGKGHIGNHTIGWFEREWGLTWLGWSKTITGQPIANLVPRKSSVIPVPKPVETPDRRPPSAVKRRAYLIEHPNPNSQLRDRRPNKFGFTGVTGGIVVHTAESPADTVGPDSGNTNVARFIGTRSSSTNKGSYHAIADSDDWMQIVPFYMCAYGEGTGGNDYAMHVSFAIQAAQWAKMPKAWRDAAIENGARAALAAAKHAWHKRGIVVPARLISAAEYRAGKPGFVTHGMLDPGRRSDPGKDFPMKAFLTRFEELYAAWNFGEGKVKNKPEVKKTKKVTFRIGTANIQNVGPNLTPDQVESDLREVAGAVDLGFLQEIGEARDHEAVIAVLGRAFYTTDNPNLQSNTHNKPVVQVARRTILEPVGKPTATKISTGLGPGLKSPERYLVEQRYTWVDEDVDLPDVVGLAVHYIQQAWSKKTDQHTNGRRERWDAGHKAHKQRALALREKGLIVVGGGDMNRVGRGVPLFAPDQLWIAGGTNGIDHVYTLLPKGVEVDIPDEQEVEGLFSDHDLKSNAVTFIKK